MTQFIFKFYIRGENPQHLQAAAMLRGLCVRHLDDDFLLDVIDVAAQPAAAAADRILATPALLKLNPAPARRIVGDCSSPDRLLQELGIERAGTGQVTESEICNSKSEI